MFPYDGDIDTSSADNDGSMLFNFLTDRFISEKKNWDAATSNNPVLFATTSKTYETCTFHRLFCLFAKSDE